MYVYTAACFTFPELATDKTSCLHIYQLQNCCYIYSTYSNMPKIEEERKEINPFGHKFLLGQTCCCLYNCLIEFLETFCCQLLCSLCKLEHVFTRIQHRSIVKLRFNNFVSRVEKSKKTPFLFLHYNINAYLYTLQCSSLHCNL